MTTTRWPFRFLFSAVQDELELSALDSLAVPSSANQSPNAVSLAVTSPPPRQLRANELQAGRRKSLARVFPAAVLKHDPCDAD
jgi:hypothetical protein